MLSTLARRLPLVSSTLQRRSLMTRPTNWKAAAPAAPAGTTTFDAQPKLPRLPVADLDATLAKFKESLKPIAHDEKEYAAAVEKMDEFERSPISKELHSRLVQRAEKTEHWLEEWWDDGGYLGYRDSVVIHVSYYYGFDAQPSHLPKTPAARAAALTRATMYFRKQLKLGQIKPEGTKEGPMCMDTYRWMFDCCRVPGPEGLDWSVTHAKAGDSGDSGHIVVFRKNRVWRLDAAKDGKFLSTEELQKQFQYIIDNTTKEYPGVGVLAASNRDIWAKDYAELMSNSDNAAIVETIQSAAFSVSLDTAQPNGSVDFSRALWHGELDASKVPVGLRNRWVDKPVQYIVFDNGEAGIMGEHSVMDGTPTARMCDNVLDFIADPKFDHGSTTSSTATPTPFDWHISSKIREAMTAADSAAAELVDSQALGFLLTDYGKAAIKTFGVSPDSWAQMIVQLAYARLLRSTSPSSTPNRRNGGTYEAATTRRYLKGRTEAIRVVSSESDKWVESMLDESVPNQERKRLFGEATKKHLVLAKSAGLGHGVDRLLYGFKKVLKEGEEMPAFFSDPVVQRSSYWVLSTSAIFSKHFPVYGWGEVVPDGFGVAYMTGYDDRLQYTITSRREMPNDQFCKEIARAAVDLYQLHSDGRARL